jgi:hypothetical protein
MQKFLVRFKATIVENLRLENWAKEYFINDIYEVDSDQRLAHLVNERHMALTTAPGLTVFKDGGYDMMPPGTGNITKRVFIPWHMIAALEAVVSPIVEQKPDPAQEFLEEPDLSKIEGPVN